MASAISVICCGRISIYYNETRTHLSLDKDAPVSRAIQTVGRMFARRSWVDLHHQYVRIANLRQGQARNEVRREMLVMGACAKFGDRGFRGMESWKKAVLVLWKYNHLLQWMRLIPLNQVALDVVRLRSAACDTRGRTPMAETLRRAPRRSKTATRMRQTARRPHKASDEINPLTRHSHYI